MPDRTCVVPDCGKPARSAKADYCPMHYHRLYRHGDLSKTSAGTGQFERRYRAIQRPDHPIARSGGKVYVHRLSLYEAIGPGPHPCHWCGTALHWTAENDQTPLQVDHLDSDTGNNDPDNLVPSCHRCNTKRGSQSSSQRLRANGWFCVNDTVARLRCNR